MQAAAMGLPPSELRAMPTGHRSMLRRLFLSGQAGPHLSARTFYGVYQLLLALASFGKTRVSPKSFDTLFPELSIAKPPAGWGSAAGNPPADEWERAMAEFEQQQQQEAMADGR